MAYEVLHIFSLNFFVTSNLEMAFKIILNIQHLVLEIYHNIYKHTEIRLKNPILWYFTLNSLNNGFLLINFMWNELPRFFFFFGIEPMSSSMFYVCYTAFFLVLLMMYYFGHHKIN